MEKIFNMSETQITKSIIDYLKLSNKGKFWRQNTGAMAIDTANGKRFVRFGTPGAADITGIKDGIRYEIEIKTKTGKQSPSQREFQKMIESNGGKYILARSIDDIIGAGL